MCSATRGVSPRKSRDHSAGLRATNVVAQASRLQPAGVVQASFRQFEIILFRMPFLSEALRFAENPATSVDQLRLACEILSLNSSGTHAELRARLLAHLNTLDSEAPVVCLNPKVQADIKP